MKKRETSAEERALFRAVIEGKVALSRPKIVHISTPRPVRKTIAKVPSGINGGTSEKLHRGDLEPETRIDLHGLTEAAAHAALVRFLVAAARRGVRLALVITGKGIKQADRYAAFDMEYDCRVRGVLRNMVPRWLAEPPLVRYIADIRHAHVRHGGEGALYVYLRKTPG